MSDNALELERITSVHLSAWLAMRRALWPDTSTRAELEAECREILADPQSVAFIARVDAQPIGFVEVGMRPYAEGCETSPVGYLEGWYVEPRHRGQGVGRALVDAALAWCGRRGLREMGSDTWLDRQGSIDAHRALGFEETERIVCFKRTIPAPPAPHLSVEEAYNLWAARYDVDRNRTRDLAHAALQERFSSSCELLVELGCGTGALLERLPGWQRALGLDLSSGMLERARQRLAKRPVELLQQSITEPLPLEDERADAIVISLVLEHVASLRELFAECHRISRPHGRLFVAELHPTRLARGGARFQHQGQTHPIPCHAHTFSSLAVAAEVGWRLESLEELRADGDAEPRIALWRWRRGG